MIRRLLIYLGVHVHSWTNWSTLINERWGVTYWRVTQTRRCTTCNKVETDDHIRCA